MAGHSPLCPAVFLSVDCRNAGDDHPEPPSLIRSGSVCGDRPGRSSRSRSASAPCSSGTCPSAVPGADQQRRPELLFAEKSQWAGRFASDGSRAPTPDRGGGPPQWVTCGDPQAVRDGVRRRVTAHASMCQAQPAKGVTAVQHLQFPKPFEHAHPPVRNVNDYEINRKAEEEVRAVLNHLSAQDRALTRIVEALASRLHALPPAGDPPGNTSPV